MSVAPAGPAPLLGRDGLRALDGLLAEGALLAFDFDGTLAPIVDDPDAAALEPAVAAAMERLCALAPVAVVTGRSIADVAARLPFTPRHVVGNHGMEGLPGESPQRLADGAAAAAAVCRAWIEQLAAEALPPGVMVEDKRLSLSVHWRNAPDPRAAEAVDAAIARLRPAPKRIAGKCVANLLPPGARTKRDAIERLLAHEHLQRVLFVGDDATDEAAFVDAPPAWLTVRVAPFERTAARWCLGDQRDVVTLIETLVRHLAPATGSRHRAAAFASRGNP